LSGTHIKLFFSYHGVIGIDPNGNFLWDGLWHSKLSNGTDHIGTRNWMLATMPVIAHPTGRIQRGCVIGLGTGISSATLAKLNSIVAVDTYEINPTLEYVLRPYRDGTLGILDNPKNRMLWRDARAGLALGSEQYDVVVTQPLYLKQAGSGLLNSREFLGSAQESGSVPN
jgi:spermidine synthase